MWSSRWRRQVVSEGPLKGPDGTSGAAGSSADNDEWVLFSGVVIDGAIRGSQETRCDVATSLMDSRQIKSQEQL